MIMIAADLHFLYKTGKMSSLVLVMVLTITVIMAIIMIIPSTIR